MLKIAHITLVEDNPGDVLLVRKALQERGIAFELTCFDDGEEALKSLSRQERDEPDIILLDLNLPKTEGVEVLRRIRSIPKLVKCSCRHSHLIGIAHRRASHQAARRGPLYQRGHTNSFHL